MALRWKNLKEIYYHSKKSSLFVYVVLNLLVIFCMINQILLKHYDGALLCALVLLFFSFPIFVQKKFAIQLPNFLEIMIYLFLFSSNLLGEVYHFYSIVPIWDFVLHLINGFLCVSIGVSLIGLLNHQDCFSLSSFFVFLFSFCFSMTISIMWEFGEYAMDNIFFTDAQKDVIVSHLSSIKLDKSINSKPVKLQKISKTVFYDDKNQEIATLNGGYLDIGIHDTMKDLFANLVGAIIGEGIFYFSLKRNRKNKFLDKLLVVKV